MAEQTGWGALLRVVDTILPGAAGALVRSARRARPYPFLGDATCHR